MTEKRFKVYKVIGSFGEWSVEDTANDKVVFGSIMHKYEADRLCAKLNELAEENEQLKRRNKGLQSELQIFKEDVTHSNLQINKLTDENEQLKKEIMWWKYKYGEDLNE